MAKLLRLRRGTTTQHSTFTGAEGEVTIDTTKDTLVVHDNATAGGRPLLREDVSNLGTGAITSTHIADGTIVDADINASAAIAKTKISGTAITAADTGTVTSTLIADGTIVNGDINASAGIAHTKLAGITAGSVLMGNASAVPTATALTGDVTISSSGVTAISAGAVVTADIADGAVTSAKIADGTIANADINAAAAIDKTKISGTAITAADTGTVTNTMLAGSIAAGKISGTAVTQADSGTVTSTMIADGTIVNGDINASAAIADTKLATISTAGKVSNSATTATSSNTASAIVTRDASGNFSAGTITANTFSGSGASLTSIPTSQLSGTINTSNLPSGVTTQITSVRLTNDFGVSISANSFTEVSTSLRPSLTLTNASTKILLMLSIAGAQDTGTNRYLIQQSTNGGGSWSDVPHGGNSNASHGRAHFGYNVHADSNQLFTSSFTMMYQPGTTGGIIWRVLVGGDVSGTFYFNRSIGYQNNFLGYTSSTHFTVMELL
jgi:hypothetical protein